MDDAGAYLRWDLDRELRLIAAEQVLRELSAEDLDDRNFCGRHISLSAAFNLPYEDEPEAIRRSRIWRKLQEERL